MSEEVARWHVECFRSFIAQRLGLNFYDDKLEFLETVIRQRLHATACRNFSAYERCVLPQAKELQVLAELLTVGETYFFRYSEHFRAFSEVVIPEQTRRNRQLRILSAGCASGEEVYSLAILLSNHLPSTALWNLKIHGVDINPAVIKKALRACYPAWSLRDTPADVRLRYFHKDGAEFAVDQSARSMATFEERNLVQPDDAFWRPGSFDVVFCRNVIMYLTPDAMEQVIARIARSLTPGGFLFLGHAETLRGISPDFHLRHTHGTFYYQLREHDEQPPARSSHVSSAFSPPPVPVSIEAQSSWFDVIQRASERVANLTNGNGVPHREAENVRSVRHVARSSAPWDSTRAMQLLQQEKYREVVDLLRGLPPGSQSDPDAQLLLASLLTNRGELADAETICFQLLDRDELNAGAHYLMALCREHAGQKQEAAEHDRAAIYLDSAFAMPHLHLGLMAKRERNTEIAKRELGQALALLAREDAARILLFGGGFTREALSEFCRVELVACGGGA